jgi:hypothetical protein
MGSKSPDREVWRHCFLEERLHNPRRNDDVFSVKRVCLCASAKLVVSAIPLERIQSLRGMTLGEKLHAVRSISGFFSVFGGRGCKYAIPCLSYAWAWKRLKVNSDFDGLSVRREFFLLELNADDIFVPVGTAHPALRQNVSEISYSLGMCGFGDVTLYRVPILLISTRRDERSVRIVGALGKVGIEPSGPQDGFLTSATTDESVVDLERAT